MLHNMLTAIDRRRGNEIVFDIQVKINRFELIIVRI
jgi:hypothetical protein